MKLIDNASKVLRYAWSVRLNIAAGLFIAAESIVPAFSDAIPRNIFAVLALVSIVGANIARFVLQTRIHDGNE